MESCGTRVQEPHSSRADPRQRKRRWHPCGRAKDFICMCMGVNSNWRRTTNRRTSKPSARIERWVLRLQGYKVIYRPGKTNSADALSRLNQTTPKDMNGEEIEVVRMIAEVSQHVT